ncbi:MAG: hypothetical protein Q9190_001188 [Brigantiaea leucoxantha]
MEGCITGTGKFLKAYKPSIKVVGVCNATNDPIPGPRSQTVFDSCLFPWRDVVDSVESITSVDAYRLSMLLSRSGFVAGPSSGMALKGLFNWLQKARDENQLDRYRQSETGDINCVFICCDLPYQYLNEYFARLGEEEFRPMLNEELLEYDTNGYDVSWELDKEKAAALLTRASITSSPTSAPASSERTISNADRDIMILDLRSAEDYSSYHIPHSVSTPLQNLTAATPPPLADLQKTGVLIEQWAALKSKFDDHDTMLEDGIAVKRNRPITALCYNGQTSKIASAILRARGLEAYSVKDGIQALRND